MVSIISKVEKYLHETEPKNKRESKEITVRNVRLKIIGLLGGKCVRCGYRDFRALQIDHVNGGGCKEIRTLGQWKTYVIMYKSIVSGEKGRYQILCANCNWIKRHENKESSNKKKTEKEMQEIREKGLIEYGKGLSDVEKYVIRKKSQIVKQK